MQFLQEQIDHLLQQTELAVDQMRLVKDQLNVETNARIDAQVCWSFPFRSLSNDPGLSEEKQRTPRTQSRVTHSYSRALDLFTSTGTERNIQSTSVGFSSRCWDSIDFVLECSCTSDGFASSSVELSTRSNRSVQRVAWLGQRKWNFLGKHQRTAVDTRASSPSNAIDREPSPSGLSSVFFCFR